MTELRSTGVRADVLPMSGLVVQPWARYGHHRLYVQTADGTRLGYLDVRTGTAVLHDEAWREAFEAVLAAHQAGSAPASGTPVIPVVPVVPVVRVVRVQATPASVVLDPVEPEWTDLAATKAGAAARERAVALRQAAPVKTFFARAFGLKSDERAWRIGADAEEAVAARLKKLGDAWKVLHAVPVGENGSDIDHVVVGPGGVFTINTKHHPDSAIWVGGNTFMVDGQRVPYVRNSRFEARRAAAFLTTALGGVPVFTTGLIAVMGARKGFTVRSQPPDGDVVVITRRDVGKWLSRRPEILSPDQVEAVYAVAGRSDTWRKH